MQDKNCCESRRYLVELGMEIFKGKEIDDSHMQSSEWISVEGAREFAKMRDEEKLAREELRNEINCLGQNLERCKQRIKQADYENVSLREEILKKSEQTGLLNKNNGFDQKSSLENAKKIEQKQKQFFNQQTMAISRDYYHAQSQTLQAEKYVQEAQTEHSQKMISGYLRPLQENIVQKEEQAESWRRKYEESMDKLNDASVQLGNIADLYRCKHLFVGQVFDENEYHKEILVRHIEEKGGKKISKTRLLYRFDPLNKTNFHKYIDGIEGIALAVKSKKGFLFGAYYSGKIEPEDRMDKFGMLISISNDASYPLKEHNESRRIRAVLYDNFDVIFGMSELRLLPGKDSILCYYFGRSNSFQKHDGKKIIDFVGEQNYSVEFQTYQFYQVRLNNEA